MDLQVRKVTSAVFDKNGKTLFAGTDTEAVQWAVDRIAAEQGKWWRRILYWLLVRLRFRGTMYRIDFGGGAYNVTETINLTGNTELRGSKPTANCPKCGAKPGESHSCLDYEITSE